MRGSVVFLAVFAVTSCSVGVDGAHFVKSGITGHGTGRGNWDAPGVEESAFGNGENDGHRIGKRSDFGRDVAKQAAFRSAAARRRQMIDPNAPFQESVLPPPFQQPILYPQFPSSLPPPPIVEVLPWDYLPRVKSDDLPSKRAMPSMLERKVRPLSAMRFLPLSKVKDEAMKIISNAHILPAVLPKPSAWRSFARGRDFYRSELKNRRGGYPGSRSYSPLRSYPILPRSFTDDVIAMPLYKSARNTAPGSEENFRKEIRSAVVKYLVQLWSKISKWFEPGSHSGGDTGGVPPEGEIPVGGGKEAGPGLPEEHEVHTERPPEEEEDDGVIIEPVTPPVDDDDVEVIHLSAGENDSQTGEDSTGEGGSDYDYYEFVHSKPQQQTNWEVHSSKKSDDSFIDVYDDTYIPSWYGPMTLAKSMRYSNWEARRAMGEEDGSEDVASKIKDSSSGTRGENMPDDLDTLTDIFGRLADD